MKKLLYVVCLLLLTTIFSFSKIVNHSHVLTNSMSKCGTCGTPYNLQGTFSGTNLTLTWQGDPSVTQYSYGGYLNPTGTFSGTTGGNIVTITVPYGTTSGTFRVNALCSDGTSSQSAPQSF